jgi:hypothetical protein
MKATHHDISLSNSKKKSPEEKTANPEKISDQDEEKTVQVSDRVGRVFVLKRPPFLDEFKWVEALGQLSENRTYMGMISVLQFIFSIDGERVFAPTSKLKVDALIKRVGRETYADIAEALFKNFFHNSDGKAFTEVDEVKK